MVIITLSEMALDLVYGHNLAAFRLGCDLIE